MKKNALKSLLLLYLIFNLSQMAFAENPQNGKPVRYLNQVFENIDIQKDIEFGTVTNFDGKSEKLLLDVYSPQGDTQTERPVMLLFHGGGFRPGNDKTQSYIVRLATDFSKRGYVCVSANYRVRTTPKDDQKGTMADAMTDAMSALDWIRSNHEKLKVDLKKTIVGGGSAGGMLAVNFCYKDPSATEKWDKGGIIALLDLWGSPDPSFMFSTVDKNDPPTILVHGTADKLVNYNNSVQLAKQLESNHVKFELVTLEGGEHTPVKFYDLFAEKIAIFIFRLHARQE
jgi:acetyl esterase/lipase